MAEAEMEALEFVVTAGEPPGRIASGNIGAAAGAIDAAGLDRLVSAVLVWASDACAKIDIHPHTNTQTRRAGLQSRLKRERELKLECGANPGL